MSGLIISDSGYDWPILDIARALETEPEPLDFVLPGLLAGTVGSLVAPGATGKSFLALQVLAQITTGRDTLGVGEHPTGTVVFLAAEDPSNVLHMRIKAVAQQLSERERGDMKANSLISPCLGKAGDLMDDGKTVAGIEKMARGARLVVIDTLSRWHGGEENERRDAARVMRAMERIAADTGAAVVFLHHANKAAALNGDVDKQQSSRGSSVFVDEARWVAFLQTMTEGEAEVFGVKEEDRKQLVRYGVTKANYCPPLIDIWLRREAGGVLVRREMPAVAKAKAKTYAAASGGRGDDNDW